MREEPTRRESVLQAERSLRVLWDGGSMFLPLPEAGVISVGRGAASVVRLPLDSVSRTHCLLHVGDSVDVEDVGSSNGTTLGGRRMASGERAPFPAGVALGVGGAVLVLEESTHGTLDASLPSGGSEDASPVCVAGSAFERALTRAEQLAVGMLSVLITGETGVGKEFVAERIRSRSQVAHGPFVRVNAAALPETLAESELFGHEKGAFTGATQSRPGLIELADGGTLYLDEIGELSLSLQPKLLRAVEAQEVTRVGARTGKKVRVRFISATNRNLPNEIAAGRFRADLYHRLSAATVVIPPLRERREEIAALALRFLSQAQPASVSFSSEALQALTAYAFPGNVRELRNIVERAVLLSSGSEIGASALGIDALQEPGVSAAAGVLPRAALDSPQTTDLRSGLAQEEHHRIETALERAGRNQTHAAEALGISRSTLLRRMRQYDIRR